MAHKYIYHPLDRSENDGFRILELQPGSRTAPIICNLVCATLAHHPAYDAISYVWGSSTKSNSIKCDGKKLFITNNLRDALIRVRRLDRPRWLWVDSLCIDQDNLTEKGHQVQSMGKIYGAASCVLIFLGVADNGNSQKAMTLVREVSDMVSRTLEQCSQELDSFPHLALDDPLLNDERWEAFDEMMSRPWFERGWVVQEAALAKTAIVLWGTSQCTWTRLMDTLIWLSWRTYSFYSQVTSTGDIHKMLYLAGGCSRQTRLKPLYYRGYSKAANDVSLPDLLDSARSLRLTNPVDRVFAFIEIGAQLSHQKLRIEPDYKKTAEAVFTEFAVAYIQSTGDLRLLRCIQHTEETIAREVPSWVPLWTLDECQRDNWDTPTKLGAAFAVGIRGRKPAMKVEAIIFDTIYFTSDRLRLDSMKDVAHLWWVVSHLLKPQSMPSSPERVFLYIVSFLCVICWGTYHGQWAIWKQHEAAYCRHIADVAVAIESGSSGLSPPRVDYGSSDPGLHSVHLACQMFTNGRKFAVTKTHRYCGLAPHVATDGDLCAFLPAVGRVFMLRPTGSVDEYKILGEAYFMGKRSRGVDDDGEGFQLRLEAGQSEDWLDWGIEQQMITLV